MAFDLDGFVPATPAPAGSEFYNATRDAPVDPTVPAMIDETGALVREFLDSNQAFANQAIDLALETIDELKDAVIPAELPDPPAAPVIISSFNAALGLGFESQPNLGELLPEYVGTFTVDPVVISAELEAAMPSAYVPLISGLNIPAPPSLSAVPEPTEPGLDLDFVLPTAPAPDYGGAPDLDEIVIPVYTAPVLPAFNDVAPNFTELPPSPFIQWQEPEYVSTIKTAVQGVLAEMLAGGTGLPEDVELAIWERARDRESTAGAASIDSALTEWATRGFDAIQGRLNAQVVAVREETERKINTVSREAAINQADLEQKNRQFAVANAIQFEQVFTAVFLAIVERNFQIAKFAVENQIAIYNLQITAFNVAQQVYAQRIAKYRVDLEIVLTHIKAFEAQVLAEKAKAEVNQAKVASFEALVRAFGARVEAYKALIAAAGVKADLQKNKVEVFKAQIDGMVAKINGQRSRYEAYDSQVKGEVAKVGLEDANARVYATTVQAWGQKADVYLKRADVELQGNRQKLDWNIANMQRVSKYTDAQLQVIQSNLAAFQANTARSVARYGADKEAKMSELQASVSLSQVAIAKYAALMRQWEVRAGQIVQYGTIQAESLKAAGTIVSNMVSGALAGTHVSAGISASTGASQSSSRSAASSTSQSQSRSESNSYGVSHVYQHRV